MYSADARIPILLCTKCRAGGLFAFAWHHAGGLGADRVPAQNVFEFWQRLRYGNLHRCRSCHRAWHLDDAERMMTVLPEGRLELVLAWNRAEILLADRVLETLAEIGPTPPDIFGNNRQYVQIPCGVATKAGERIDAAIVSLQHSAPIEDWRTYRLGSEITEIYPSQFTLPLDVRLASTQADEIAMGFAPSLIVMPDGRRFTLNGTTNFLDQPGYSAAEARIDPQPFSRGNMPASARDRPVLYFVADG